MGDNGTQKMDVQREDLDKVLGRFDVLAMAFGTMIGFGWVMMTGYWVETGGVFGAVLAFLIGAVMCAFVGMVYAELTPMLPLAGGEMVFAYRAMGYKLSWVCAWAIGLAYVGITAFEGVAICTAIDYVLPIPKVGKLWSIAGEDVYLSWALVGIVLSTILCGLNYMGAKNSSKFQVTATVLLTLSGLLFFFGGTGLGSIENTIPRFNGTAGLMGVLLMVPSMFVGFDVIPQAAEEMNIPLKQIASVLLISIAMAATWYIMMIVGISFAAPPDFRHEAAVPVADAISYVFGTPVVGYLVMIGAIAGILTSWNGFIMGASRVFFSMGRAKMLPEAFGKVHPKYGSPYIGVIIVYIISVFAPLLGEQALVWIVNASAFGTVIAYLMVSISFALIRKQEHDLARPFKVKNPKFIGTGAIVIAIAFGCLYMPGSSSALSWPYEWGIILGWCLLGVILYFMNEKSYGHVTNAEREYLIFGDKYSRKDILEGSRD